MKLIQLTLIGIISKISLFVLCLGLVSCSLEKEDKQEKKYAFFKKGIECDSTYTVISENSKIKTIYCLKEGTENFVKINSEDTVLIRKHINKNFIEKTRFKNNHVSQKSLLIEINDSLENLLLNIDYNQQKLDVKESLFFEFKEQKDSFYFRLNPINNVVVNSDSILISDFINYYPVFDQVLDVNYSDTHSINGDWIQIPKDRLMNNEVIVVLVYSDSDLKDGGISIRTLYLDYTIYKWCKKNS